MSNARNTRTTHPKVRARRLRALERLERGINGNGDLYKEPARAQDITALHRKLGQRKQGSAA